MNTITEKAYAKINLALDITGRLPNGYHTLRMVMETISIHDDLMITRANAPGLKLTCHMEEDTLSVSGLDCGEDNLIIKAARALLNLAESKGVLRAQDTGLDMKLNKRIPMAAGLAGGSSDAAAVLRGINKLLGLGFTNEELCETGVTIGADVPYCILGGSMLAEGIGEVLTPISAPPVTHILIAKPDIDVSTAYVYRTIDASPITHHPDVDGMITAIGSASIPDISSKLGNVLRDVTVPEYPIVGELEQTMRDNGASGAMMSGSGPTVFGLYEDETACMQALDVLRTIYPDIYISHAVFVSPQ